MFSIKYSEAKVSSDESPNDLMIEVPVLKQRVEHAENSIEKHEEIISKLTENCTLLSQGVVAIEQRENHLDYLLKWVLGVIVGSFAGILVLLLQTYIK